MAPVSDLVNEIETEAIARHRLEGTTALGVAGVLRQDPYARPSRSNHSPAPYIHAACKRTRQEWRAIYSELLGAFRTAAEKLKAGCRDVVFPEGCFPPSLPFCRSG